MLKIDVKFDLALDGNYLIDFIQQNTGWEWNDICEMEYKYRKEQDYDNYPLIEIDEQNDTTFQYWVERFLETYKDEIGNKTIYVIQTD